MEPQTVHLEGSGIDAHYLRGGSGEPLLYLHHMMGLKGWEPALERLAESFDVIAPYHPGWGPAKDYYLALEGTLDLVLYHADLLDALGVERAHIAGVGIGAWMAAEVAAVLPHRVDRLVLVNPVGIWLEDAPGEDPFAQSPASPSAVLFADPEHRQLLLEGEDRLEAYLHEALALRAAAKYLWPLADTGVERRLGRIKAPALVVTSDRDRFILPEHGRRWQSRIPGAELTTLADAGHIAELEQPEAFATLVREWVANERVAAPVG